MMARRIIKKEKRKNNKFENLSKFFKRHKKILPIAIPSIALLILIIVHFVVPAISKGYNWVNYNFLTPNRIYLNLFFTQDRRIPLNGAHSIVYMDIKENAPTVMRFSLIQNNDGAPEISTIFLDFPSDVEVKPIRADGRIWVRTNSPNNQYSIGYSDFRFTKGTYWDLPPFEVTFKETKSIDLEYSIIGNKMKGINKRRVKIYPAKEIAPHVFETQGIDVRNTASGPVVDFRTQSPGVFDR